MLQYAICADAIPFNCMSANLAMVWSVGLFDALGKFRIGLKKLQDHLLVVEYISAEIDRSLKD